MVRRFDSGIRPSVGGSRPVVRFRVVWQSVGAALEVQMIVWFRSERGWWMINPLWWLAFVVWVVMTVLCRDWRRALDRGK